MSACKFIPRAVASLYAPQKPFVRKRARCRGVEWVQVTRHPAKQAKKPCTINSQQQRFMCVSGQVCNCLLLDRYLYHIVLLRPNSCIFEFCTPKFINIAYLIVLSGSDMLELPPAKGNMGCKPVQAAQADR